MDLPPFLESSDDFTDEAAHDTIWLDGNESLFGGHFLEQWFLFCGIEERWELEGVGCAG